MAQFLLLFRAPKHVVSMPRSPEAARASGEKWHAWGESIRKAGQLVTAGQLQPGGQHVTGPARTVGEGAFGEEHVVGGYFVVEAKDQARATDLAKGCPVLDGGGTVEVRPLMQF